MGLTIIMYVVAGLLAGVVTGLAGASAATVVTPILVAFGGIPVYTAITVSLFSDVLASGVSAFTYYKNGNIKLQDGKYLAIFSVIGSVIGSYLGSLVSGDSLGSMTAVFIVYVGISFIKKSIKLKKELDLGIEKEEEVNESKIKKHKTLATIGLGLLIGIVAGFIGAGGGLMILLILTSVLGFDTKSAIGTSVFIMAFTALSGGLAHIPQLEVNIEFYIAIVVTSIFAVVGAKIAAVIANKVEEYILLRLVAGTFLTLSLIMIIKTVF